VVSDEQLARWGRIEANLRRVVGAVEPADDRRQIEEYLDHNELGLAFEDIVSALLDCKAELTEDMQQALKAAAEEMGLGRDPAWRALRNEQ
jgi:hypothetical protein